jgi:HEPN domain-containing protein
MFGIFIGVAIAAKTFLPQKERSPRHLVDDRPAEDYHPPQSPIPTPPGLTPTTPYTFTDLQESVADILREAYLVAANNRQDTARTPTPRPPFQPQTARPATTNKFIENWRRSIVGLIRLAECNLQTAKLQASTLNHKAAVEAAVTAVENVARALLHCFGEKPEIDAGQEEPLRLLARRLRQEERAEFEQAIDQLTQLRRSKIVQTYLSKRNLYTPFVSKARTEQTIETAQKIFTQFKKTIDEHFATEIPELRETCPNCHTLNITLWNFNHQGSTYECNECKHKWTQPAH